MSDSKSKVLTRCIDQLVQDDVRLHELSEQIEEILANSEKFDQFRLEIHSIIEQMNAETQGSSAKSELSLAVVILQNNLKRLYDTLAISESKIDYEKIHKARTFIMKIRSRDHQIVASLDNVKNNISDISS